MKAAVSPIYELDGEDLRQALEEVYPGLAHRIELDISSLYGALAFGVMFEEQTGQPTAAGLWLRRRWPNVEKYQTYDKALADFADLVNAVSHDAWVSEYLAQNSLTVGDLSRCPGCDGLVNLSCRCER